LISQVLKRNSIRVGTTTTTRDFTYVEDTVNGFLMVADSDKSVGEVFNLGTGVEISIAELIAVILRLIGSGARISYDESRIRPEKSEVLRLCADNTKVQKLIGWVPRVQFEDGLNRTIGWIRDHLEAFNADTYNI
jgi:nucleoside-diphosphate-sugar epimerase